MRDSLAQLLYRVKMVMKRNVVLSVLHVDSSTSGRVCVSNAFDVVAREGTEEAGSLAGADVPTVVAIFQHADHVAFLQLKLVNILRCVSVKCSVFKFI